MVEKNIQGICRKRAWGDISWSYRSGVDNSCVFGRMYKKTFFNGTAGLSFRFSFFSIYRHSFLKIKMICRMGIQHNDIAVT